MMELNVLQRLELNIWRMLRERGRREGFSMLNLQKETMREQGKGGSGRRTRRREGLTTTTYIGSRGKRKKK